jgi:hypothetical protein
MDSLGDRVSDAGGGRELGVPIHLVIFTSLGSRRKLSPMRSETVSGKGRWEDNLLVSGVPTSIIEMTHGAEETVTLVELSRS